MKKLFAIVFAAIFAASCSSLMEKEAVIPADSALEVRFRCGYGRFETKSLRVEGFKDGDTFGIFAYEPLNVTNALYTAQDGRISSNTPIHWLKGQEVPTAFFATCPYIPGLNFIDNSSVSVKADQSTEADYNASDFQKSELVSVPAFDSVYVDMSHRFARIDFELSKGLAAEVVSLSVDGIGLSYDLSDGSVSNPGSVKAGHVVDDEGVELWSVILPPQKVNPTLTMLCSDGGTKTAALKEEFSFEGGYRYLARVSVREEGDLEIEFALRIFQWLEDDVFLSPYVQKWGIYREWDHIWTSMTAQENNPDLFALKLSDPLPKLAEFCVALDGLTEYSNRYGAECPSDGSFAVKVVPGQAVELVKGGCNLLVEEGGNYHFFFNNREKTLCLVPPVDWYLYDVTDLPVQTIYNFSYTGPGLTYAIDRVFVKPEADIRLVSTDNGNTTVYGGSTKDPAVPGEPYPYIVTSDQGVIISQSGFYSITLDTQAGTLLLTLLDEGAATVEDVLHRMPDGAEVTVSRSTVYGVYSEGFVLSDNGKDGVRVILSEPAGSIPSQGDVVTVSGVLATLNGQKVLAEASFDKLENGVLAEVAPADISDLTLTSNYSKVSVPVKVRGTLGVVFADNDRYYITTPGGTAYIIPESLPEAAFEYAGAEVEVNGWYLGYLAKGGCHALAFSSMDTVGEIPDHGKGTMSEPFDVVGAWLAAGKLPEGCMSADSVYIKGRVLSVTSQFSLKTGQASFVLSTTATGFGSSIDVLGTHYLDGDPWTLGCYSLEFADEVTVCGAMANEGGGYRHTVAGMTYLAELNGTTSYVPLVYELLGEGTRENPCNVATAVVITNLLPEGMASKSQLYVKGVVTGVARNYASGRPLFYISDDRGTGFDMELSGPLYLGAKAYAAADTDVAVGDTVVVSCCPIGAAGSRVSKFTRAPWLYRLNDVVKDYVASFAVDLPDAFDMQPAGGVGTFHLRANCDWTVKTDPWIEMEMDDEDPELAWLGVEANNTGFTRTGHLTFTFDEGRQTKVITITQEPTEPGVEVPVLDFDPAERVLWQGKHQLVTQDGGSIGMTELAYGKIDWNTVSAGYLVVYFGSDWNKENHMIGGFTVDPEGKNYYIFRTQPDPGNTEVFVYLTEERLEHLRGAGGDGKPNGGLVLIGENTCVYAVTWFAADPPEDPLVEPSGEQETGD